MENICERFPSPLSRYFSTTNFLSILQLSTFLTNAKHSRLYSFLSLIFKLNPSLKIFWLTSTLSGSIKVIYYLVIMTRYFIMNKLSIKAKNL
jgi:hypothetical protein